MATAASTSAPCDARLTRGAGGLLAHSFPEHHLPPLCRREHGKHGRMVSLRSNPSAPSDERKAEWEAYAHLSAEDAGMVYELVLALK